MSVNVRIMQAPAHRRSLDLAFIRQLAAAETLSAVWKHLQEKTRMKYGSCCSAASCIAGACS